MDCETVPAEFKGKESWNVLKTQKKVEDHLLRFDVKADEIPELNPSSFERVILSRKRKFDGGFSKGTNDDGDFKIQLTWRPFEMKHLNVSTANGMVIIRSELGSVQEEAGTVSKKTERCYILPNKCDVYNIETDISNGSLTILCKTCEELPEKNLSMTVD